MKKYEFPKGFVWGTAAGSYQIEGAWNEDGKGENIWDRLVHSPGHIKDGSTADVTVDFYHKYNEDIDMMAQLGYQSFIYTISWARILPKGTGEINQKGIDYYRAVLKKLKDKGIHTMLALYHWDLPQALQDRGGWANREIIGWFSEYAKICYREFGDLVDDWITFVEPASISLGYSGMGYAPNHKDDAEKLLVAHHVNLCHGIAVKLFRESGLKSRIGIKMSIHLFRPDNPESEADVKAAAMIQRSMNDFYMDPLFKGKYPDGTMEMYQAMGTTTPEILPGDMELMFQPTDFFGLNAYTPMYAKGGGDAMPVAGVSPTRSTNKNPRVTAYNWEFADDLLHDAIHYVWDNYKVPDIIVTESGCGLNDWKDYDGTVKDPQRVMYLKNEIRQVYEAIEEGIPIQGYHIWSLFDNFEWLEGFTVRFGIVYVDYETLERIPKSSAYWYSDVAKSNEMTW